MIGGLSHQGTNVTHEENISENTARQCIGVDVNGQALAIFWGPNREAQDPEDHATIKKDSSSIKKDKASSKKDKSASGGSWYTRRRHTP